MFTTSIIVVKSKSSDLYNGEYMIQYNKKHIKRGWKWCKGNQDHKTLSHITKLTKKCQKQRNMQNSKTAKQQLNWQLHAAKDDRQRFCTF